MKSIVCKKLIIELNDDGTFKSGLLQYQIQEDGILGNKKYTIGINEVIQPSGELTAGKTQGTMLLQEGMAPVSVADSLQGILNQVKQLTEQAEGITQ